MHHEMNRLLTGTKDMQQMFRNQFEKKHIKAKKLFCTLASTMT